MDIQELYRMKGELHVKLEIAQQMLQRVNQQISEYLNKQQAEPNGRHKTVPSDEVPTPNS